MAERRSMNEALTMTPEKLTFIKQDSRSKLQAIELDRGSTKEERRTFPEAVESVQTISYATKLSEQKTPVTVPGRQSTPHIEALVPLTTRLLPSTASALKRAYLERKLSGDSSATQQQIVEEALQQWLEQQGYLTLSA